MRNPFRLCALATVAVIAVVVMALPCLFLFLILQRYYVQGFMSGAIKG
jgi:multiple sugar transport system permease protein